MLVFKIFNNKWTKGGYILLNGVPKLDGAYLVVAVYKNVAHSLDSVPGYFGMSRTEFLGEFVASFAYDFYVLDKSEIHDGVGR